MVHGIPSSLYCGIFYIYLNKFSSYASEMGCTLARLVLALLSDVMEVKWKWMDLTGKLYMSFVFSVCI